MAISVLERFNCYDVCFFFNLILQLYKTHDLKPKLINDHSEMWLFILSSFGFWVVVVFSGVL